MGYLFRHVLMRDAVINQEPPKRAFLESVAAHRQILAEFEKICP